MKKLNNLAKEINEMLLEDVTIKRYLKLKQEIENDQELVSIYQKLDSLRKEICKNKEKDSSEYYKLLNIYKSDIRVKEYENLKNEVSEFLLTISEILQLK